MNQIAPREVLNFNTIYLANILLCLVISNSNERIDDMEICPKIVHLFIAAWFAHNISLWLDIIEMLIGIALNSKILCFWSYFRSKQIVLQIVQNKSFCKKNFPFI